MIFSNSSGDPKWHLGEQHTCRGTGGWANGEIVELNVEAVEMDNIFNPYFKEQ